MGSVLLGGVITLIVTALVQIFLIPWVQRRTRAIERWEKDIDKLLDLVNDEFYDKIDSMAATTRPVALDLRRAQTGDLGLAMSAEARGIAEAKMSRRQKELVGVVKKSTSS
jgi:hypothetical protein